MEKIDPEICEKTTEGRRKMKEMADLPNRKSSTVKRSFIRGAVSLRL